MTGIKDCLCSHLVLGLTITIYLGRKPGFFVLVFSIHRVPLLVFSILMSVWKANDLLQDLEVKRL